jgi:hypothetical protein
MITTFPSNDECSSTFFILEDMLETNKTEIVVAYLGSIMYVTEEVSHDFFLILLIFYLPYLVSWVD